MPADENGSGGEAQGAPIPTVDLVISIEQPQQGTGTSPPGDYTRLAKAVCCVFARRVEMARRRNEPIPPSLKKWVEWVLDGGLNLCVPGTTIPNDPTDVLSEVDSGDAEFAASSTVNVGRRTRSATNQFFSATVAELDDWNEV